MSSNGVPLQEISDTVGHKFIHVAETVYRRVIVPAIRGGATVMDQSSETQAETISRTLPLRRSHLVSHWILKSEARRPR